MIDKIDKALVAVAINVAASLGSLRSFAYMLFPLFTEGNGLLYFLLS